MNVPDGSIYQLPNGNWAFIIDAPPADGKRRRQVRRRLGEDKKPLLTERAARRARDELRDKLRAGTVPKPADGTVAAFAVGWIAALPAEGIEASTVRHYRESIDRLMPTIGDIAIQQLITHDLDRAYTALRERSLAPRTIRHSHVAVKKMLAEALRVGTVGTNVALTARPPARRAARPKRFPTWTLNETCSFLDATADDPWAACWWTMAFTGVRRGEIVALRWDDVDLDRGVLAVTRAVAVDSDRVAFEKVPKSDAGHRQVELDDTTIGVLRDHRRRQLERRMAIGAGWRNHDELVFVEVDGSPIHPDRQSKRWHDLIARRADALGVKRIRLHDLRHSHATQLLAAGTRPDVVTKRLGHSNVAFTLQTYGHVYEGDQRSAMSRLLGARGEAL